MPCNEHQLQCNDNDKMLNTTAFPDPYTTPTSSNNNGDTVNGDEKCVSVCTCSEEGVTSIQTAKFEQRNGTRMRIASSRSISSLQLFSNALHPGEELDGENWTEMDFCRIMLTQFRIIISAHNHSAICAIPLTGVDLLEAKDIVGLQISCKDGKIIKFRAENNEMACAWYKKLMQKTCIARDYDSIFAFQFYTHSSKRTLSWLRKEQKKISSYEQLYREFRRLEIGDKWRISTRNETFEICSTYPQFLIVPNSVVDEELKHMSYGRYYRRFPTLVWRNRQNGSVLLRSSQPSIGFFGMSNDKDVSLYDQIRAAISSDPNSKILIVDARSYTAAWANRAKGGGFEATDTYINSDVVFMGLPNIHNIRYSFFQLRQLLNSSTDPNIFLQTLQSTLWLQYIGQLFTATEQCLKALCFDAVSVLVHCSDGWDRTTQIVSLCMLISDPFYRTFEGFEQLIQRQWVEFGHKFGDRGGVLNSDENEKSPVFLQFLDCVYQLWEKNSDRFEFNRRYLMKLLQHTFSGLFGTFLFNSICEARKYECDPNLEVNKQKCYQVWDYLGRHNIEFHNPAYNKKHAKGMLRFPKIVPELLLWRDAYCCTTDQLIINNPEEFLQQSNGVGINQDIAVDKTNSTLSRSQSAASLTSLIEQSNNLISNHSNSTSISFMLQNPIVNCNHSIMKMNDSAIVYGSSTNFVDCQNRALDVDGLSKVPILLEDQVMRRLKEQEKQNQQQQQASKIHPIITGQPNNTPLKDGLINCKLLNGECAAMQRRTRNESVDSSFEIVGNLAGECCSRLKHNSSSSLTSVCQPSSLSSNCTTMSDFTISNGISKSGIQEGVEINDSDRIEHSQLSISPNGC